RSAARPSGRSTASARDLRVDSSCRRVCAAGPAGTIPGREWRSAWPTLIMDVMAMVAAAGAFAHDLRRWRRLRGWSQLDLALRADTTQRYLSFREQGRSQ